MWCFYCAYCVHCISLLVCLMNQINQLILLFLGKLKLNIQAKLDLQSFFSYYTKASNMHFQWMRWKHFELTSWKKASCMTQRFENGNTHCDWLCPCACMYVCMYVCMCAWVEEECVLGWGACAAVVTRHYGVRVFHGVDSLPAGAWAEDDGALLGLTRSPPENRKRRQQPHTCSAHENKPSSATDSDTFPLEYANTTIYAHTESVHHCASYMRTHCI